MPMCRPVAVLSACSPCRGGFANVAGGRSESPHHSMLWPTAGVFQLIWRCHMSIKTEDRGIGSLAESCEADERKPDRTLEAPCQHCGTETAHDGFDLRLCESCTAKLIASDLEHFDLRMAAMRTLEMFRRMDALDVPTVLVEAQARLIEQHLIDYIPKNLISKQAVENEIALWRARTAARKAG